MSYIEKITNTKKCRYNGTLLTGEKCPFFAHLMNSLHFFFKKQGGGGGPNSHISGDVMDVTNILYVKFS